MSVKKNMLGESAGVICCDFCEAEILEKVLKSCDIEGLGWTYGHRGEVEYFGVSCRTCEREVKHACSKELCKAKLFVWTRS